MSLDWHLCILKLNMMKSGVSRMTDSSGEVRVSSAAGCRGAQA
jgi:hypothetical protein